MQEPEPEVPVFPDRTPPASAAPQSARHCAVHAVSAATVPTAGAPLSCGGGARSGNPRLRRNIARPDRPAERAARSAPSYARTRGLRMRRPSGLPRRNGRSGIRRPSRKAAEAKNRSGTGGAPPPAPFRRHAERPASRRCGGPASYSRHLRRREKGLGKGGGSRAARRRARTDQYL